MDQLSYRGYELILETMTIQASFLDSKPLLSELLFASIGCHGRKATKPSSPGVGVDDLFSVVFK